MVKVYAKDLKCPVCGKTMELDDRDYRFSGCQDEYWKCPDDCSSAFVKVRYCKVISTELTICEGK